MAFEKKFACKGDGNESDVLIVEQQKYPNRSLIWLEARTKEEDGKVNETCVAITRREFMEIYNSIDWEGVEYD
ncbi:hypothetical protein [Bacillus cereus]|uniref:hypothetical protein n=1 Tax=Bacillus cereus TaxID=1396 RepID=UPI00032EF4FF|nr:hypothetical protein [Bacillus cereus]EOO44176.1 hypothetical protein ICK_06433 [Bacillus cereus BAG1X2-2]EOP00425.1 hypothetical protein ICO_06381 [Bacillus cereus BAG2O-1]